MRCTTMSPTDGKWDRFAWLNAMFASDLGPCAKAAAAYLFTKADEEATCWPSVATVAENVGRSRNNTKAALDEMEAAGWLARVKQPHKKGFHYRYTLAKGSPSDKGSSPAPLEGVTSGPLRGHHVTGKGSLGEHKQTIEQTTEQTNTTPRVRDELAEAVIVQVESETGRHLTEQQARKLLAATSDDAATAAEAFIDMATSYRGAAPYKLIQFATDRIAKDREGPKRKPRNALNRPDDEEGQRVLERMLANATTVVRGEE